MTRQEPVTPRGARQRAAAPSVSEVYGTIGVKTDISDLGDQRESKRIRATVDDILKQATEGRVQVKTTRFIPNERFEHVLTLNSLEYATQLREAVDARKFPWALEHSEDRGVRENPNSLTGEGEAGFPTYVIVREALYKPKMHPCWFALRASGTALLAVVIATAVYWLSGIMSRLVDRQ